MLIWEDTVPINGVEQPEYIVIDDKLRLHQYDGENSFALKWYQDEETVFLVDGNREPYSVELLNGMYRYLDEHGELYFIEYLIDGTFVPIGDVTFWADDMPIVIGEKSLRGMKIGKKVISALVERGKSLGYEKIFVREIYDWNEASKKCFESAGFCPYARTDKGYSYVLELK